jgi:hypothetical protein
MKNIIGGILIILAGVSVLIKPISYSHKYSMVQDFSKIKYPLFLLSLLVGSILIYIGYRSKTNDNFTVEYWICPKCEDVYELRGQGPHICLKCNVHLEKLKGFYNKNETVGQK